MLREINPATACFPGTPVLEAVHRLLEGVSEPVIGPLATHHIQLCPQNPGDLSPATCESLRAAHPDTQFRTHANARIIDGELHILDGSTFGPDTLGWYRQLLDRNRRLGASATSIHAGYAHHCSLSRLIENMRRLNDLFDGIAVAVEGLYPGARRTQLMGTWAEYEAVLVAGLPLAVDLSHLNIVRHAEGPQPDLVRELLASAVEIHVSGNEGMRDSHELLTEEPWWWAPLNRAILRSDCVVFSEASQRPRGGRTPVKPPASHASRRVETGFTPTGG